MKRPDHRLGRNGGRAGSALVVVVVLTTMTVMPSASAAPGDTTRVSVANDGSQASGGITSGRPAVSADGTKVAFVGGDNLLPGSPVGGLDVFVRDLVAGTLTRVSVNDAGDDGNLSSRQPSLSADGTVVAFVSGATNLVPEDINANSDVFVRDLKTGTTTRVSVGPGGVEGDGFSDQPSLSADGRTVAFSSSATNLIPGGTDGVKHVFVRDLETGTNTLASVTADGTPGNTTSGVLGSSLNADGTVVAFVSDATNLVPGDSGVLPDVFVRDLPAGTTTKVSVDPAGDLGNGLSGFAPPSISADGTEVAFVSNASNLVAGDTNDAYDIFVRDVPAGTTTRVSLGRAGAQSDDDSNFPSLSADGTVVAFSSAATNLVPGDTNDVEDVFVRDVEAASIERVSVDSSGAQANGVSGRFGPALSADATAVAFASLASNLVPDDTNDQADVFVHELASSAASPITTTTVADDTTTTTTVADDTTTTTVADDTTTTTVADQPGDPFDGLRAFLERLFDFLRRFFTGFSLFR